MSVTDATFSRDKSINSAHWLKCVERVTIADPKTVVVLMNNGWLSLVLIVCDIRVQSSRQTDKEVRSSIKPGRCDRSQHFLGIQYGRGILQPSTELSGKQAVNYLLAIVCWIISSYSSCNLSQNYSKAILEMFLFFKNS